MKRRNHFALLASFFAVCVPGLQAAESEAAPAADGAMVLWYRQPAEKWTEALPLGNGRLGAMVFGRVENERIQLNEDTVWARSVTATTPKG